MGAKQAVRASSSLLSKELPDDLSAEERLELLAFECQNQCAALNRDCSYQIYEHREVCKNAEYRKGLKVKNPVYDIKNESFPVITNFETEALTYEQCLEYKSAQIDARFTYLQQGMGCSEVNICLRECDAGYAWWIK